MGVRVQSEQSINYREGFALHALLLYMCVCVKDKGFIVSHVTGNWGLSGRMTQKCLKFELNED